MTCSRVKVFLGRGDRVGALVALIAVMSLIDLHLTVLYLSAGGMGEDNPLARGMMSYGSAAILSLWKLGSVALGVGILVWARGRRSAEIGAWCAGIVMALVMHRWVGYIEVYDQVVSAGGHPVLESESTWVRLDRSAPALTGALGVSDPIDR